MVEKEAFEEALNKGYTFIQSLGNKDQYFLLVDVSHKHKGIMSFGSVIAIDCLKGIENKAEVENE